MCVCRRLMWQLKIMVLEGRRVCDFIASPYSCSALLSLSLFLSPADNPIQCSCDTQELWEWLRNHLKLILSPMNRNTDGELASSVTGNGPNGKGKASLSAIRHGQFTLGAEAPATPSQSSDDLLGDEGFLENTESEFYASHLRCDQPASLRGRILMEMEPHRFCDAPLILKVAIQDIQPYAVHVSWQTREHSGLHGYHVVYRSMEGAFSTEVSDMIILEYLLILSNCPCM